MQVCRKVEEKGTTTYNEVADELVAEFMADGAGPSSGGGGGKPAFDEKNIRRRVYDALNVLMAMDIISKDKKEIQWKGLPSTGARDQEALARDTARLEALCAKKREQLALLMEQQVWPPSWGGEGGGARSVEAPRLSRSFPSAPGAHPWTLTASRFFFLGVPRMGMLPRSCTATSRPGTCSAR